VRFRYPFNFESEAPAKAATDFLESYAPFRDFVRGFDIVTSLIAIWELSLQIIEGKPLFDQWRRTVPFPSFKDHIYPWDLDVLSREFILNASRGGRRSLRDWNDLATCVNYIRDLDGIAYTISRDGSPDVMFELHRIAQRQFPWQVDGGVNQIMRVIKVFGSDAVDQVVQRELGMTARQFVMLGMAVAGHFQRNWGMLLNQDYRTALGIERDASGAFFERLTCSLPELTKEIQARQRYDGDWLYTWNPLEATPLIRYADNYPDRVICPIPRFVLRRTSAGLFYDVVKAQGFDNPYGTAFQGYVGEVLRKTCPSPPFTIRGEKSYRVDGSVRHGVDWILSDKSGHLFVEAKTKRLTVDARTLSDSVALNRDLETISKAIVQHYANIRDAQLGLTDWKPDGLPIYPLVLTLEDWFLMSPSVRQRLDACVLRMLHESNITPDVLDQMPFTIASSQELEIVAQVIAQTDIGRVMSYKVQGDKKGWLLSPAIRDAFPDEMKRISVRLFGDDLLSLLPVPQDETKSPTARSLRTA